MFFWLGQEAVEDMAGVVPGFSSESSRRQNERCLIAGGCFVPSSSGEL